MTPTKTSIALASALLMTAPQAIAAAGNFLLVSGGVQVMDAQGRTRQATPGAEIASGDTVLTQAGRAQIRFTDSGQVSLQPGTEFKLADYRFRENGSTDENAFFSLLRGGIRVITGAVGRRTKSDYRVSTPTATIGIRGTEFQATLCAASCKEPDGLYVQTGEGVITVRNALGEIDVGRGETAYVASPDSGPRKTSAAPAMTAASVQAAAAQLLDVAGAGEFQPGSIATSNSFGPVTPITGAGLAIVAAGALTVDGIGYSDVTSAGAGSGSGLPSGVVAGVYLNGGQLNGFVVSDAGSFATVFFDQVRDAGSNGDLYWGRWSGGNLSVYAGLNNATESATAAVPATAGLHYLLGTSVPTVPTSGSATFTFVGGTPSTDLAGGVGTGITAGSVTANFSTSVVNASLVVVHGGTINVNAAMPMNSGNRAAFSSTNPGGFVSGASGSVSGFLSGTGSPSGAGLSYSLNGNVVGVGAFR